jgi:hypothetical protein
VALQLLTPDEAYESIDWQVILLLAGIIPLGLALQKTGGATMVADQLLNVLGPYGPVATLAAIYLLTSVLTEVMSNNASAVLVVPIALATAESMGVDAKPLLIAVAFPDQLPDQHHGLHRRRLPLQRLRQGRHAAQRDLLDLGDHPHPALLPVLPMTPSRLTTVSTTLSGAGHGLLAWLGLSLSPG